MSAPYGTIGRPPVASTDSPRIKQTTRYQLHLLRRAKLLNPGGPLIHQGIGTYDTLCLCYVEVFHNAPEVGENAVDYRTFQGGCVVEQLLVDPVGGVWERLVACKLNPQPWTATHNCQHTANWIFFGIEDSPSFDALVAGVIVLAVGTVAALAARQRQ